MDSAPGQTGGLLVAMLKTELISVAYGSKNVLQDISLDVPQGEILALIGPNGAGKTTLVRAVSGTVPLTSGHVSVDEQDLSQLTTAERARILAVVPDWTCS